MSYEAIKNVHSELLNFMKEQMEYNVYLKNRITENEHKLGSIKEQFDKIYADYSADYSMVVEQIDHLNSQNDSDSPTTWKNYFAYNEGDIVIYPANGRLYKAVSFVSAGKEPTINNGFWHQLYKDWDASLGYSIGDLVYYTDNKLYRAAREIIAGSGEDPTVNTESWNLA